MAWGITASLVDVSDLFNEKVVGDQYLVDGEMRDLRHHTYELKVKGEDPQTFVVRESHRGPVLPSSLLKEAQLLFSNKVPFPKDMEFDLSMSWAGHRSGDTMFKILEYTRSDMDLLQLKEKAR